MLVYRMTLLSLRLFHKNLGNLREFFEQVVHFLSLTPLPPAKKWLVAAPMIALVGLTRS